MKILRITTLLVGVILAHVISSYAQDFSAFEYKEFKTKHGVMPYRILYPEGFDSTKFSHYPVLFFLHGRGESGNDNKKQLTHGAKMFLDPIFRLKHPAIIIFPQCPENSYWSNVQITTNEKGKREFHFQKRGRPTIAMQQLLKLAEYYYEKKYAYQSHFYVGGLSMGGMGTYEMLRRSSILFAGAFAICGGDLPENTRKYKRIPLWVFHGEKDDVVPPEFSHAIVRALQHKNKELRYCFFPNDNHNSWDSAFATPELLPWLFEQDNHRF